MSFISQFRTQIRTYIYHPVYKGPFEYKKVDTKTSKFPFGINKSALERQLNEIKEIQIKPLLDGDISPFHLVWRYKPFFRNSWNHKLILRRLGLHQRECKIPVVIPNTPHYNQMLWEVKHLIQLKPLKFPNGLPTEADIGSVKVDLERGEMYINSAYKIPQERLDRSETPPIFMGKYLQEYLKWSSGVMGKSLPHHEILSMDGNHIEDHDKAMKDYYKHQHKFYK